MKKFLFKARFVLIPLGAVAMIALAGFVVMFLWNNVLTDVLHVSALSFWQAVGIFLLCKLLFGFTPGGRRRCCGGFRDRAMHQRFKGMNDEDKEKFRQRMMEKWKCGDWGSHRHRGPFRDFGQAESPTEDEKL